MDNSKIKINWPLVGNDKIKDYLTKSLKNKRISGSYIFAGPDNLGKTSLAVFFANVLLCSAKNTQKLPCGQCPACLSFAKYFHSHTFAGVKEGDIDRENEEIPMHSDFVLLKKGLDKKNISVEQVRQLIKFLSLSSFLGSYKIAIIKHAEELNEDAANALLKTIEEPRKQVILILIAPALEVLLPTIVSRSQIFRFTPVPNEKIYEHLVKDLDISRSYAKDIAWLAQGRPALAEKLVQNKDFFNKYAERSDVAMQILKNRDINVRLKLAETIALDAKDDEKSSCNNLHRTLEIWQVILRDIYLASFGHYDVMVHQSLRNDLIEMSRRTNYNDLFHSLSVIDIAKSMISSNIGNKLILDYLTVNI
jgi:DNA polymerase-3 subunit delta'